MKDKIQRLKIYLRNPEQALKDNFSLLIALQEILNIRKHNSHNTLYDREIYELFHATMILFLQPIIGDNVSRWDLISHVTFQSDDEKAVRLFGFNGTMDRIGNLWHAFQDYIQYSNKRQEGKQTLLQKICNSYLTISFPYEYTIEYEKYILNIEDNIEDSVPIEKEYSGIANALREYIRGASDNDLATIINTKSLPQGASKKEWIGKKVDAHRFRERIGMKTSQWNKCFQLPQRQKLTDNMKGQSTYKEKNGKCDILNILQRFCL